MSYTCVVPMGPQDKWTDQVNARFLPLKNIFDEVLLVGPDHSLKERLPSNFRRITSAKTSRAHLLNKGAYEAKDGYLCFLHFDTDFDSENFARLRLMLKPEILYYFEFNFLDPSPSLAKLNVWAANFRANIAHIPMGNQCYNLSKKSFLEVGAFSERLTGNEDAEFMKRWKQKGYKIKKAKGVMKSSAQKYFNRGWLKTTAHDLAWTLKFWAGKEPKEFIPHT